MGITLKGSFITYESYESDVLLNLAEVGGSRCHKLC